MNTFIKLAFALVDGGMLRQDRQSTARMACLATATIVAVVCAMAAIGCLLAALWIYALPYVGAVGAPAVVAGVLIILCCAVLTFMRYAPKLRRRIASPPFDAAPALLLAQATRLLKEHKGPVLIAALLAGLVAGTNDK
jgi:hypothetical protein